jgi:ATP adenylyltransferase
MEQMGASCLSHFTQEAEFNIGIKADEAAGLTIFHCHVRLIPRRVGDVEHPRGGVRGVVPGRQDYR